MITQKYNYWNEIVTSNNAVVNQLQTTNNYQQYSSFNHLPTSGITGNLSEPTGGIGGGESGNYNYNTTGDSGGNYNMTPPCTNIKCFDSYSNDYVKDIINRISEKESEKSYMYDKTMASDYYDCVTYDSSNGSHYDQSNNHTSNNINDPIRHEADFKKSNILSKFYKPDGTPLKSLWDTDNLIKEQRSYKYDPKPLERRKNPRAFVPDDKKTNDYWEKRRKNNLAARKSREDRRKKEIEVLKHVNNMKTDNMKLKLYAQKIMTENQNLKYEVEMLRRL